MYYNEKIWIGDADGEKVCIHPKMANRHGLIAGATGTGKTVTLKVLALYPCFYNVDFLNYFP